MYSISKPIKEAEIVEAENQKGCKNAQIRVRLSFKEDVKNAKQSKNKQSYVNEWIVELRSDNLVIDVKISWKPSYNSICWNFFIET